MSGDKENTITETPEEYLGDQEEEEEEEDGQQSYSTLGEDPDGERLPKRFKTDHITLRSPPFYFNLHRHCPKGYDLGKINKIVEYLQKAHYKASRTHFDPEAVRTNCSHREFTNLLLEFSKSQN
ncbi:hypothetical protein SK128_025152 [Halocaridina rubra]|uniref:Uncharacterized protein n=1 Tax=Halocaridina rubra TaxID=373956 RepID=A0AAN9A7T1_HALRR